MAERLFLISVIILTLVVSPGIITASDDYSQSWRELNQTSDKILQYVREGHYEEAHQLLDVFSDEFMTLQASGHNNLSMRDLNVITSVYEDVEGATVQASLSHNERVNAATKLRLLVDVYETSHQPLWLKTKNPVFDSLQTVKVAASTGEGNVQKKLNRFLSRYEVVRPAWSVSLQSEKYTQLESQIQFLNHLRERGASSEEFIDHLNAIELQLSTIFEEKEDEVSDPQLIWVMITIGGAIIAVLSYAGWKKYKGEREKELERKKMRRGQNR
ncbi:sporulation protein YpjB [Bacillus shivajii]|uniref:sporulation protein YpjB n=1 Tax=Bacillus shivajii TaxID=1983719 RepID=UPI001CFBCF15|nr:sporulation protein YpjB [Bacillus shivajii]UCZ54798.1 sporulation protein YpjB [Bacillus shivajii]